MEPGKVRVLIGILCVLGAAGELGTLGFASYPSTSFQGRAKLSYPVWHSPDLVVMPGISAGAASVEAKERHQVRDFGGSVLFSHPLDSSASVSALASVAAGAESGRFAAEALQASIYLGWRRSLEPGSSWGIGFSVSNSPTGTSMTPVFTWERRLSSHIRVSALLPAVWNVSWEAAPSWDLGVRQTALGGSWLLDSSRSLSSSQMSLDLFGRRRFGFVALDVSAGWMFLDQRRYVDNDRSTFTIYGYDVFSSQHATGVPNRTGAVVRCALLFPGRN